MELKRENWFNDVYLIFNDKLPNNFCDYFWGSLKTILMCLFLTTIGILLTLTLLSPIILIWDNFDVKSTISSFQIIGISLWIIFVMVFIIYNIVNYYDNKEYECPKDSVVKIWYKDFKNKHCTFITWK